MPCHWAARVKFAKGAAGQIGKRFGSPKKGYTPPKKSAAASPSKRSRSTSSPISPPPKSKRRINVSDAEEPGEEDDTETLEFTNYHELVESTD